MARWTEQDIAIFWEMKREGASLIDIADRLGREYKAVQNLAYNQKKKIREKNKMDEIKEVTDAPKMEAKKPGVSHLDITIQQTLAMIRGQGMAFDCMHMSLSDGGATLELHFARREV